MKSLLKQLGYNVISDTNSELMPEWLAWYGGYVKKVHDYTVYNGKKRVVRRRHRGALKKACACEKRYDDKSKIFL